MFASRKLARLVVTMGMALAGVPGADTASAQKEKFVRSKPHVNVGNQKKPKSLYFPESMLQESKHGASGPVQPRRRAR
jgi:hypothetical protein